MSKKALIDEMQAMMTCFEALPGIRDALYDVLDKLEKAMDGQEAEEEERRKLKSRMYIPFHSSTRKKYRRKRRNSIQKTEALPATAIEVPGYPLYYYDPVSKLFFSKRGTRGTVCSYYKILRYWAKGHLTIGNKDKRVSFTPESIEEYLRSKGLSW